MAGKNTSISLKNGVRMPSMDKFNSTSVLGTPLERCSVDPITGFFRDGCCNTGHSDRGMHTVCAVMTEAFLAFSLEKGNDLSTPLPQFGFRGLLPGDQWCLCASRWVEAYRAGVAPQVKLSATHEETLAVVELEVLKQYAVDGD